ncbi:MAG TPA: hypothetical protein VG917_05015 [Patescibacteria group bacterium]|nr:hypothetical protein [Patescibacteria group bacterium]
MHKKAHERGQAMIALIIGVIILGSIFMTGGIKKHVDQQIGEPFEATITGLPDQTTGKNLQLKTFLFTTGVPTPPPTSSSAPACGMTIPNGPLVIPGKTTDGQCCVEDGPANNVSECCPGVAGGETIPDANLPWPAWCDAKPAIYLYPEIQTKVNVKVTIPGKITVSIPHYKQGGWEGVLANPDGKLTYQGKNYPYLFYETMQEKSNPPKTGDFVLKKDLDTKLTKVTSALGLNEQEQKDFLSYWIPRLNKIDKKYILVSYFSPEQKLEIDKVDINPKPTTFIQFIMYYKGVDTPYSLAPLDLPANTPARKGFTAVEWGGILEN